MKSSKVILIVVSIIIILLVIAWIVSKSNKTKTENAIINQPAADANITGRYVAVSNPSTDFSEIVNGKAKWLWAGKGNCNSAYTKILSGVNSGWCVLNESLSKSTKPTESAGTNKQWCCESYDTSGNCNGWISRDTNKPCGGQNI